MIYHMQLAELSRQIAHAARELQGQLETWHRSTQTTPSTRSTESIESTLSRIENRLSRLQADTGTLVERVPPNLSSLLTELKEIVLQRLDSLKRQSTESTHSIESTQSASNIQSGKEWTKDIFQKLTYQEQKLFRACFQSGLVTYPELAQRLGIAPTSAKNLVNRLFAHPDKRRLFKKELLHGIARIGVAEPVERKILKGENKSADKKSQHKLTVDT